MDRNEALDMLRLLRAGVTQSEDGQEARVSAFYESLPFDQLMEAIRAIRQGEFHKIEKGAMHATMYARLLTECSRRIKLLQESLNASDEDSFDVDPAP